MNSTVRFVALDVHADSIVIAVAGREPAEVLKTIPYDEPRLLKELKRLGPLSMLRVCSEAGPTGFGLQRFLQYRAGCAGRESRTTTFAMTDGRHGRP